jgi:hypothetical protein
MLVISEGEFKRHAVLTSDRGMPLYAAEFGMHPRANSKWMPWLVPTLELASRFGVSAPPTEELALEPRPEWRSDIGFLGESEVIRQLGESGNLNLFRPFPDSETAEIAVLHLDSRRVIGLQVKTVGIASSRMRATVDVYSSSFRPSPTTYIVVLAWLRDESRFHEECLVIPSTELRSLAKDDGYGHLSFDFRPGAGSDDRLVTYRAPLTELQRRVTTLIGSA